MPDYRYLKNIVEQENNNEINKCIDSYFKNKNLIVNQFIDIIKEQIKSTVKAYYGGMRDRGYGRIIPPSPSRFKKNTLDFTYISNDLHSVHFYTKSNQVFICRIENDYEDNRSFKVFLPNEECLIDFIETVNSIIIKDRISLNYKKAPYFGIFLTINANLGKL